MEKHCSLIDMQKRVFQDDAWWPLPKALQECAAEAGQVDAEQEEGRTDAEGVTVYWPGQAEQGIEYFWMIW